MEVVPVARVVLVPAQRKVGPVRVVKVAAGVVAKAVARENSEGVRAVKKAPPEGQVVVLALAVQEALVVVLVLVVPVVLWVDLPVWFCRHLFAKCSN